MCKITQALAAIKQHIRPCFRSATVYVAACIIVLPDIALYLQEHWEEVAPLIPDAWTDRSVSILGWLVLIGRLRTLIPWAVAVEAARRALERSSG